MIPNGAANCCRCGKDFPTFGKERICPACRNSEPEPVQEQKRLMLGRPLSFRESQVVERVKRGLPNKEIAFEIHLTEGTVKMYMNRIFRKTGATNRTELAVMYVHPQ
jgi:DNA-binding NarL/FixJ family response regulator